MMATAALGIGGLVVRFAGAVAREQDRHWIWRLIGWFSCMIGVWLMASAAGAWSPLWIALVFAAGGMVAHMAVKSAAVLFIADAALMLSLALDSIPSLEVELVLVLAAGAGMVGYVLDKAAAKLGRPVGSGVIALQCVGVVAVCAGFMKVAPTMPVFAWHAASPTALLNVAVVPTYQVQKVDLAGGVVAWLDLPGNETARPTAVFFHGSHRDGAQQPAAQVMRRALLDAGFSVLSIDHPGFGASRLPEDGDARKWDPLPAIGMALQMAREMAGDQLVVIVGHSMGCLDVMRTLAAHAPVIDAAVLFGGAVNVPRTDEATWEQHFYADRGITQLLDAKDVVAIRALLYDPSVIAKGLPDELPPIVFVRFGIEHENVAHGRDHLAAMFPTTLKYWDFDGATHYFNAWRRGGVLVADRSIAARLAERLKALRRELEASAHGTSREEA